MVYLRYLKILLEISKKEFFISIITQLLYRLTIDLLVNFISDIFKRIKDIFKRIKDISNKRVLLISGNRIKDIFNSFKDIFNSFLDMSASIFFQSKIDY